MRAARSPWTTRSSSVTHRSLRPIALLTMALRYRVGLFANVAVVAVPAALREGFHRYAAGLRGPIAPYLAFTGPWAVLSP